MKDRPNVFRDPGITVGHLRVLPMTTGGFVVYDEQRELGKRGVAHAESEDRAEAEARRILGLPPPARGA